MLLDGRSDVFALAPRAAAGTDPAAEGVTALRPPPPPVLLPGQLPTAGAAAEVGADTADVSSPLPAAAAGVAVAGPSWGSACGLR